MSSGNNRDAIHEMFQSVKYMITSALQKASFDKSVRGTVVSASGKPNHYNVSIKGKTYELPSHINNLLRKNQVVDVMIPQNNMSLAFIYSILGGETGGSGGGGSDYAVRAGYAETVAVATETNVGGVLSGSGEGVVTVGPTGKMTIQRVPEATKSDLATNVENVPQATSEKLGGVKSSTGTDKVEVLQDGTMRVHMVSVAETALDASHAESASYAEEVAVATTAKVGGIISTSGPGHVSVAEDGTATVEMPDIPSSENLVTMKDSAEVIAPEEWGEGPWEIIVDEETDDEGGGSIKAPYIIENPFSVSMGVITESYVITNEATTYFNIHVTSLTAGTLTINFNNYEYPITVRTFTELWGSGGIVTYVAYITKTGSVSVTVGSGYQYMAMSFTIPGNPFTYIPPLTH